MESVLNFLNGNEATIGIVAVVIWDVVRRFVKTDGPAGVLADVGKFCLFLHGVISKVVPDRPKPTE
jgi:hypothetical protein